MKEIGEFLKQTRIQNGVSIEEASEDLNLSIIELENLEDGNIRAFKDVYILKELVREYSKYLGIEPDRIMDEFNDFMFDHTSKISLDDIREARKLSKEMEEKPKIVSPYTLVSKKKFKFKNLISKKTLIIFGVIAFIIILIVSWKIIFKNCNKVSSELMGKVSDLYNEFSY